MIAPIFEAKNVGKIYGDRSAGVPAQSRATNALSYTLPRGGNAATESGNCDRQIRRWRQKRDR